MTVLLAIVALVAAYAGFSRYVRLARKFFDRSEAVWDRLFVAAQTVINDKDMPGELAAFSAAAVVCAGCGCLTGQLLRDAARRKFRKPRPSPFYEGALLPAQRSAFGQVVVLAIYYDSLQMPLLGLVLRRVVMPWLSDAARGHGASKRKIAVAAASSRSAISDKPEGRRVLALA